LQEIPHRIYPLPQLRISAVIITLNEETVIERCIRSLEGIADEVVVVDSFSKDKTVAVAESLGARVIQHAFDGYGPQKRRAVEAAQHEWILSLDADEALSPRLRQSILQAKTHQKAKAYQCNRLTNYCGRWIRHGGWYPDKLVRLWHREAGSISADAVHERWEPAHSQISIGHLKGDLLHYSFPTFATHLRKLVHYSESGAQHDAARGKQASLTKVILGPTWVFVSTYFLKLGFLDGYEGFLIARASAVAAWMKYASLHELTKKNH
jgi:hypothetical protein